MKKISITETFDDTPINQADIDASRLILRKRSPDGSVIQPKKRVTIYLDAALIERFKGMAGERGYQTLINDTLKTSLHQTDMESAIRKVIREELKGRKAA